MTETKLGWEPAPADVARAIRSRTYTGAAESVEDALVGGKLAGEFGDQTNPTKTQVEAHIADAVDDVLSHFASGVVPEKVWRQAKRTATLKAALAIELAAFESGSSEGSPYLQLRIDASSAQATMIGVAEVLDAFGIEFPQAEEPEKPEGEVQ
jgi:hypothetical protein